MVLKSLMLCVLFCCKLLADQLSWGVKQEKLGKPSDGIIAQKAVPEKHQQEL